MTTFFDPMRAFQGFLSGDVNQRITSPWFSPAMFFNFAGDAAIEERVVTDVASYGRQIGWLNEIVLKLAKNEEPSDETVTRLEAVVKDIEDLKARLKKSRLETAIDALDQLCTEQPEAYAILIQKRNSLLRKS